MDIALSLIGLTLSLVAAPFIALAIWLEDGRPIFYVQTRVGLDGRLFNLWKFRTMLHGAEEHSGARWAQENDPRVTRVGSFLRSTHLDELPQFWSVLRGHMSLVGPRPERPELVAMLVEAIPGYASRTLVRPGITGVAQLQLGYVNSVEDSITKLRFDVAYITSSRLRTDLHCILRTIRLTVVDLARVCVKTVRNGKASGGAGRDGRQLPAGARSRSTPTESELL
jgi:lipopolysaccharide/colanic/teichoic acid biosynthesis glycosyltransferase